MLWVLCTNFLVTWPSAAHLAGCFFASAITFQGILLWMFFSYQNNEPKFPTGSISGTFAGGILPKKRTFLQIFIFLTTLLLISVKDSGQKFWKSCFYKNNTDKLSQSFLYRLTNVQKLHDYLLWTFPENLNCIACTHPSLSIKSNKSNFHRPKCHKPNFLKYTIGKCGKARISKYISWLTKHSKKQNFYKNIA